jgi:AAA+ ATPase superfamily predicted ATPase
MRPKEFIGRENELKKLFIEKNKGIASLNTVRGRRRIGKSRLVKEFSKDFDFFLEFQGLGPEEGGTNQIQLDYFKKLLSQQTSKRESPVKDWTDAFYDLSLEIPKNKTCLILLDEISWMGKHDKEFPAKLKSAWDRHFSSHRKLVMVLCGSVSSWIEKNILENADFLGRISLDLQIDELLIPFCNKFFDSKTGSYEKALALSVTGGIPKYLEEISSSQTIEQNIVRLCFTKSGFLYNEFKKIFSDIFGTRSKTYEKLIRICIERKLSPSELAESYGQTLNSDLSDAIHILEVSGFLSRDYLFKTNGEISSKSIIRLKDNYLRFYLKHIEPLHLKIEKGGVQISSLRDIKGIDAILGLQFENLMLANRSLIHHLIGIENNQILSSAPYIQKKDSTHKAGCQIDLLINTSSGVLFVCEFKFKKRIGTEVIKEVEEKIKILKTPKRVSVRPVLVYEGELSHPEKFNDSFFKIIPFSDLLSGYFPPEFVLTYLN